MAKLSAKSSPAGAFRYAINRQNALSRFFTDGRLEVDNHIAENAMRGIATHESLLHPIFKCLETLEVDFGGQVTRAAFTPDRRNYRGRGKISGEDLERRNGNDLLGAKQAGFYQPA